MSSHESWWKRLLIANFASCISQLLTARAPFCKCQQSASIRGASCLIAWYWSQLFRLPSQLQLIFQVQPKSTLCCPPPSPLTVARWTRASELNIMEMTAAPTAAPTAAVETNFIPVPITWWTPVDDFTVIFPLVCPYWFISCDHRLLSAHSVCFSFHPLCSINWSRSDFNTCHRPHIRRRGFIHRFSLKYRSVISSVVLRFIDYDVSSVHELILRWYDQEKYVQKYCYCQTLCEFACLLWHESTAAHDWWVHFSHILSWVSNAVICSIVYNVMHHHQSNQRHTVALSAQLVQNETKTNLTSSLLVNTDILSCPNFSAPPSHCVLSSGNRWENILWQGRHYKWALSQSSVVFIKVSCDEPALSLSH